MNEDLYAAYLLNDSSDANQISAAAAACSLLFSKRHEKLPSSERNSPSLASSFQPELDSLADLTRQIQELQLHASNKPQQTKDAKPNAPNHDTEQLASLHCQRARLILECVDYDASTLLSASFFSDDSVESIGNDEPEEHESDQLDIHEESDRGPVVNAVEKALGDALAAIALVPASVDAYFIAAQCARSLGRTSSAVDYIALALQFAPESQDIQQLSKQLSVDAKEVPLESLAPPVMTSPQLLSVFDTPNQEQQQQDQQEEDEALSHDNDDAEDREMLYQSLQAGLQTLTTIVSSSWLTKLEQMMHQNVHHQCAARNEVRDLEKAFSNTATFLLKLLGNRFTTLALGMDHTNVQELLAIIASSSSLPITSRPTGGHRLLVENRLLRKWIGQTLAPAVRRCLSTLGRKVDLDSLLTQEGSTSNKQQVVVVTLLRDTLLVLTRVLLAMTGWRRCTSMPHVVLYAELCFDLSKELGAGLGASFSGLSRFEMFCSDVYARSLLILTSEHNDALQLHQESLQVALTTKDAEYEVRCHHHVGQAFMRMNELELAQSEFREMLHLSRTLGDSQMECLAQYELGECCVQSGNLPQAQTHFKHAQTLCRQTANARNTWRLQSVQHAIAFYAAMKPARRGAIRIAPSKTRHRRGSIFRAAPVQQQEPSDVDPWSHDDAPKLRRPAIWIGPPKLNLEPEHDGKRSLLETLLGEQTEPIVDTQCASGDDATTNQPFIIARLAALDTQTATAKLFAATSVPTALKKPETPKRTPKARRNGAWRDSVFAIPPSYSELKSLTSPPLQLRPLQARMAPHDGSDTAPPHLDTHKDTIISAPFFN